ncbi:hypothetical protein [Streptomyces sp. NRRL S-495]|uniref:hypothetical protein n=1 Tax=Streptomyces sp. NRRL S-495 TaxID=1609133 RepID=UPI0005F95F69|nr:hypothetical protein [Streptomyces sp. NRRL S-495]KJY27866.1 hypothetical protein VR45_33885 [Streptomyces sp. NRRL S-495]
MTPSEHPSERRPDRHPERGADRRPEHRADRPLAELLDVYWRGRVPAPVDPEQDGTPTALDELGPSGITVRGRPLEAGLAAAYRRFTGAG